MSASLRGLRRLVPYLRRYRAAYVAGLALVVLSNAFTTAGPRFLERAIDRLEARAPRESVLAAAALLVAVAVAGGVARFGMRQLLNSGSRRVETDLRDDLFAHLQRQAPAFFDRFPTGDVMARATNDLTAVRMVAGPALMYLVDTAVRALLVVPAMAATNATLTLLAVLPLAGLTAVMIGLGRVVHERARAIQDHFGRMSTQVQEHLSGVRIVRAYRQEQAEERVFADLSDEYLRRNLALARVQ
ncbi:MAG: ABC transporter transmembrane domain-containing protein, partial [Gemmatimonadales bacterium]|nr:ABC transporter transmembrane domain-containing protein [Gemmatimonadales bacterium]